MEYDDTVRKLQARYPRMHPLIFHRSVERARNAVELFDILDTFVDSYPLVWDNDSRNWVKIKDITLRGKFQ